MTRPDRSPAARRRAAAPVWLLPLLIAAAALPLILRAAPRLAPAAAVGGSLADYPTAVYEIALQAAAAGAHHLYGGLYGRGDVSPYSPSAVQGDPASGFLIHGTLHVPGRSTPVPWTVGLTTDRTGGSWTVQRLTVGSTDFQTHGPHRSSENPIPNASSLP